MNARDAGTEEKSGHRDLPVAVGVGLLLFTLFVGSLYWHPLAFTTVVAGLVAMAVIEAGMVLRRIGRTLAVPVVLVGALVCVYGAYWLGHAGQSLGMLVLFLGAVGWHLLDENRSNVTSSVGLTLLLGTWTGLLGSYGVLLVTLPEEAELAVLAVAGATILGDIGAYFAGRFLGRHRIAPTVSPNKTWEGLLGGVALAVVCAVLILPLLGDLFDPTLAAIMAVVAVVAGFFGDLTESMFKRDLGVKDLGDVLPGHGGVLDRVDGLLLALPVGYYAIDLVA